jgi:hypothetical protein
MSSFSVWAVSSMMGNARSTTIPQWNPALVERPMKHESGRKTSK